MPRTLVLSIIVLLFSPAAFAGGAWVPAPGDGDVQFGLSRKTASSSWNPSGDVVANTRVVDGHVVPHQHDFRYAYLSGELGVLPRLSARFLVTWLYGLEGTPEELEKNVGWSDAWIGAKYAIKEGGEWPMAVAATIRTPILYDLPGAYNRHLFDSQGNMRGVSPEWRGLLKHDYTLSYLASRSFREGRGWFNVEAGYTLREGAPADQIPVQAELGWPLPWRNLAVKGSLVAVRSVGNDSVRRPDDRFGSSATNNFNDASMARAGVAVIIPARNNVAFEAGLNQWLWGQSARRYREPYVSVGYRY